MKIALIGYGKMGKMVEQFALIKGHTIVAKINSQEKSPEVLQKQVFDADICIDFSHPCCVVENIKAIASIGKNIVVGTTGWYDRIDEVKNVIEEAHIGFLYSPNFSLGIALFLEIVSEAAALLSPFDVYDVGGHEIHHRQKVDAPSGTAKAIVDRLLANIPRKKGVVYEANHAKIPDDHIHFSSTRIGAEPGTHTVVFDSPADIITLTHTARNREGFADGAVCGAEWLYGKQGFFTLKDMLKTVIRTPVTA